MKKCFATVFVALSMFSFVACSSGSSEPAAPVNPAIKATENFIKNPTDENYDKCIDAFRDLSDVQIEAFEKWLEKHEDEYSKAMGEFWQNYSRW
ncbi:MAG: hypothetical protein IIW75_08885 [Bacteroidaceae bacterium]|nr:hypothetical protein [Bacteroidaceae bacterium]